MESSFRIGREGKEEISKTEEGKDRAGFEVKERESSKETYQRNR
jgi:hypothetical protein